MDFEESRKAYISSMRRDRPSNLLKHFLPVTLPNMNDVISISIYTQRTTKFFTPIIKYLLPRKC